VRGHHWNVVRERLHDYQRRPLGQGPELPRWHTDDRCVAKKAGLGLPVDEAVEGGVDPESSGGLDLILLRFLCNYRHLE